MQTKKRSDNILFGGKRINMNRDKLKDKARSIRLPVVIAFIIGGLIFAYNIPHPQLVQDDGKSWHVIWEGNLAQAAEATLGAGEGGILEIYFVNHSATHVYPNLTTTIEGWCDGAGLGYANADDFNVELAHSTLFDVVVKVRGNKTQCWRTDKFYDIDLRVRWTSSDLSVGADTAMTGTVLTNNTGYDYLWMAFYDANSGSGFSLPKDTTYDIDSIKFEAYY